MARMMNGRYGPDATAVDLALPHYLMLRVVRDAGPLRASDVADACEMSNSAVSMALQALEERGLLVREHDAEDRRVVRVTLTDQGRAKLDLAELERREIMRRYTATLPIEDLRTLARVMNDLVETMAAEHS